jgi:APA family basic amino acid/polyamine antiporter
LADAAKTFLGNPGVYLGGIGAIISMSGTLSAVMLFTTRIPFAMAEQGQLPAFVGRVHPHFRTPHVAIILSALVILAVTLSNNFISALTISAIVRLLLYVVTAVCLIVLRKRKDQPRPEFEVPGGLLVPMAAIALSVWLLSNVTLREARDTGLAAATGLVLYGFSRLRSTQ